MRDKLKEYAAVEEAAMKFVKSIAKAYNQNSDTITVVKNLR